MTPGNHTCWSVRHPELCSFVWQLQVVCVPDVTSIYRVPLIMEDQKVVEFLAGRLGLPLPTPRPRKFLMKWRDLADRSDRDNTVKLLKSFLSCVWYDAEENRFSDSYLPSKLSYINKVASDLIFSNLAGFGIAHPGPGLELNVLELEA